MGAEHCLGLWWVPPSLRVGTQSHSFIQSPILSLYKYWHMLDICKCSCIFRRKKWRENGRKERRKERKGERRTGRRSGGREGERESRLGKGLMNVQTTKYSWESLLYQPLSGQYVPTGTVPTWVPCAHSPHIEGQCPARPLPPLISERVLAVTEDYSGTLADQLLLCWALHQF